MNFELVCCIAMTVITIVIWGLYCVPSTLVGDAGQKLGVYQYGKFHPTVIGEQKP